MWGATAPRTATHDRGFAGETAHRRTAHRSDGTEQKWPAATAARLNGKREPRPPRRSAALLPYECRYECRYEERVAGRLAGDSPVWDRIGATSYGSSSLLRGAGNGACGTVREQISRRSHVQAAAAAVPPEEEKVPRKQATFGGFQVFPSAARSCDAATVSGSSCCVSANDAFGGEYYRAPRYECGPPIAFRQWPCKLRTESPRTRGRGTACIGCGGGRL